MEVVVFGAGSLGSLIGGLLTRAHDVTLVGRDPHVSAVSADGLAITGEIETTVRPRARTDVPESADLAVVTVKSYDTDTAAEALAGCDPAVTLSLQNGLGNEARLADPLYGTVLAGTCTYGALRSEPGTVRCTGLGNVTLGARSGGHSAAADSVGEAFEAAEIDASVATDMPRRLWEKLAINAGINATTALARVENGVLLDPPAGPVATAAARETARVASTVGVDLDEGTAVTAVESVADATAANESSMYQDMQAGRRTEIDAINGAVVDRATEPVPVNETLTALLRTWERARDLR